MLLIDISIQQFNNIMHTTSTTITRSTTNANTSLSFNTSRSISNEVSEGPRVSDAFRLTTVSITTQSLFEHCCGIPEMLSHILSMCSFKNRLKLRLITKQFCELISDQFSISLTDYRICLLTENFQFMKRVEFFVSDSMYALTLLNFIKNPNNQPTLRLVEAINLDLAKIYSSGKHSFQSLLDFLSQGTTYALFPKLSRLSFGNINDSWFNSFTFPHTLKSLFFGTISPHSHLAAVIPLLPEGLTHLSFGFVRSNLKIQNFPSTLKFLSFGGMCYPYVSFAGIKNPNANWSNIVTIPPFPENLETLCFGDYLEYSETSPSFFNVPTLPTNLKTLSFGSIWFDGIINIFELPDTLDSLTFENIDIDTTINIHNFPRNLKYISFGNIMGKLNLPTTLPNNLTLLSFETCENPEIKQRLEDLQALIAIRNTLDENNS